MKSVTERRLLFALLLSSLVPLVALGFLSGAAVHQMGREAQRQAVEAHRTRMRSAESARCLEFAERVSAFLRRREADLRTLADLPATAEEYLEFSRNRLAPVWARGTEGEMARIWVPLYSEVSFVDSEGREAVAVRGGKLVPASELDDLSARPEDWARFRQILAIGPRETLVAPVTPSGATALSPFEGSLSFSMPVRAEGGEVLGLVSLILDSRQLTQRIFASKSVDDLGHLNGDGRFTMFFGGEGVPLLYPWPVPGLETSQTEFLGAHLPQVVSRVRASDSGVVGPTEENHFLAYTPILLATEADGTLVPVGGVLLYSNQELEATGSRGSPLISLTRGTELQIGILTLASTFGVALAALLVARRMARPWARLREKVHAVAPASPKAKYRDEVDEISHSLDSLASQVAVSAGRLRASEERLREFIEMNPDGIAVTDPDGHLLHFNRALCQILRRTPDELAAMTADQLYAHREDRDLLLSRLREKERLTNYQVELVRGDGRTFPALMTLRLAEDHGSECIDAIVRDISDLVEVQRRDREKTEALFRVYGELSRAHQDLRRAYSEVEDQVRLKTSELRAAYESLQASDRVKTEFLMKMSHELRTPLNCIIGYSDAMADGLDGPVTAEQALSLDRIAQSGRRLLRMIENVLDLSRLEAGRMEFLCTETPLEDAIEDVIHQVRSLIGGRPLRLEIALEEPLPAVWVDPDRIRQVLFNLVGNALKFTKRGRVAIQARALDARFVEVRVEDTGPGIAPDQLESIFDKFVQVPRGSRDGAGLGLAICREIVESMGGTIHAESALGEGSVFVITVPVAGGRGQLLLPLGEAAQEPPSGHAPAVS